MRGAREDRTLVTSGPATPRFAHLNRNNDIIPAPFLEEPPPVRRLLMIHYFIEWQIKEPPRGFFLYIYSSEVIGIKSYNPNIVAGCSRSVHAITP